MEMTVEKAFRFLKRHPELEFYLIYQKKDRSIVDTTSMDLGAY
jgi:hypothetical protein